MPCDDSHIDIFIVLEEAHRGHVNAWHQRPGYLKVLIDSGAVERTAE
jgi:hypothetical protein